MQELRFDDDIRFTAVVSTDQTWLRRALGAHELSIQLAVGVSPFTEAGKILALEADLFGFEATGQRSRLARTTVNLAYTPKVTVHRVNLSFPLTSLQIHAIEEGRTGDARFEIDLNAPLPQAPGYPGSAQDTAHITIAKSRWNSSSRSWGRAQRSRWPCRLRSAPRSGDAAGDDLRTAAERARHQRVTGRPGARPATETRTAWQSSTTALQAPTSSTTDCPPCTRWTRICR
ncbi:hypothetical protein [Streptomyces sp. enrichment culture]|uniref:hypothetical protein n=1 Tax=Streptomyces sp. enrichment culture TaxID=1795815 RepID=UPI003F5751B3